MSYVAGRDIAWRRTHRASRCEILLLDKDLHVAIVRWDARFELPGLDEHGGKEIVYVLQGTFTDQYRTSGAAPSSVAKRAVPTGPAPGRRRLHGRALTGPRRA